MTALRGLPLLLALALPCLLPARSAAQAVPPLRTEEWKFDVVHRTRGRDPLQGLVVKQTDTHVHVKWVVRRAPTVVLEDRIPRKDVARIDLLGPGEREQLAARLDSLARERRILAAQLRLAKGGKVELPPGEAPALAPAPWGEDGRGKALAYDSRYFRLVSDAREDVVRLTALQLEQVFSAYERCLPPRAREPRRTTILLTESLAEYHALVRARGYNILNPAFYDPARNQVVCGSDLGRLGRELERIREYHERRRAELTARRAELLRIYNRQVPPELLRPVDRSLKNIRDKDQKNDEAFRRSHARLVQRLCHEAFHAYLARSVFGERKVAVPPWLDEGLAQLFETALLEGGELQVGRPDPERLRRVREALKRKEFLSLAALLKASPRQFRVAHAQERAASDRHYLAAWALAFYLTFEHQALGTPALDEYLKELQRGGEPLPAFRTFVGQPLPRFEDNFRRYLLHLREDGTSSATR